MVHTIQEPLASFSCFQLNGMKFGMVLKQFRLNILILHMQTSYSVKGNKWCLLTTSKKSNFSMHLNFMNQFCSNMVHDNRYCWTLHVYTSPNDLDLDSRSQEWEKAKTSTPIIHEVLNQIEWNWVYCWDWLVWWTPYSCHFVLSVLKGAYPTYVVLSENFNVAFRHNLQTNFFQTSYEDGDHWTLHFHTGLDDFDHHSTSQWYEKFFL